MRTRSQSFDTATSPKQLKTRTSVAYRAIDLHCETQLFSSTLIQKSNTLLIATFRRLKQGVWFKILRSEDTRDDIYHGTGQKCDHLLPILLHLELIGKRLENNQIIQTINRSKWESFCSLFPEGMSLQFDEFINPAHRKREFYLCGGQPKYSGPRYQIKALQEKKFAFDELYYFTQRDKKLRSMLHAHCVSLRLSTSSNSSMVVSQHEASNEELPLLENESTKESSMLAFSQESSITADINFALTLNLSSSTRLSRDGNSIIELHNRRQAKSVERMLILFTAERWGWNNPSKTKKEKKRIAKAACQQVAYDMGFKYTLAFSQLYQWKEHINNVIDGATDRKLNPLETNHAGTRKITDKISCLYPCYLTQLFRYAQKTLGAKAGFAELTEAMNMKSAITTEERPTLNLHRLQVHRWFVSQGGKECSPVEKPLDTPTHKRERKEWVIKWYDVLVKEDIAQLDEKWFYTTSRRRTIKRLPLQPGEEEGSDFIPQPKVLSRRFPIKSMFLGCIGRPRPDKGFDGKILLERISETTVVTKMTANQNFSDDVLINSEIKQGKWKDLYVDGMPIGELRDLIEEHYCLDGFVGNRLDFVYRQLVGDRGNTKLVSIDYGKDLSQYEIRIHQTNINAVRKVEVDDLALRVRYKIGDKIQKDCSCDSKFMLSCMHRVGKAIREKMFWIPRNRTIPLFMDRAGGHGTDEAIQEYRAYLLTEYNIKVIFQVPRTPYSNALDLGVWCSLQARVEKNHSHKRCELEALVRTVMDTWKNDDLNEQISRVFIRLQKVLVLILQANGGNDLVETKRGKKFQTLDMILRM